MTTTRYMGFVIAHDRGTAYATLLNRDGTLSRTELSDECEPDGSSNIHGLIEEWHEERRVRIQNKWDARLMERAADECLAGRVGPSSRNLGVRADAIEGVA